jgi:hypothetical protein
MELTSAIQTAHLAQLREQGVVLLRGVFAGKLLAALKRAATSCLPAIAAGDGQVPLAALLDSAGADSSEWTAPLAVAGLQRLFADGLGSDVKCSLEQSWVRKKYPPLRAPPRHHPNSWHQDGGLAVRFPPEPGPMPPMTPLLTCWIPLEACGVDAPGLEFVRRRIPVLLHYTELNNETLRQRFEPEEFWAPALELGDGLVFLNGTLHRTHVGPEMRKDRLSVEYRLFPAD